VSGHNRRPDYKLYKMITMIVRHYIIMKKICSRRWLFFQQNDKETLFWEVFDSLALSSADNTVRHVDLQNGLVCSGRFYTSDSYWIIQDMIRAGRIETVGFDTYRKTDSERKWLVGGVEYDIRTRVSQSISQRRKHWAMSRLRKQRG